MSAIMFFLLLECCLAQCRQLLALLRSISIDKPPNFRLRGSRPDKMIISHASPSQYLHAVTMFLIPARSDLAHSLYLTKRARANLHHSRNLQYEFLEDDGVGQDMT